MKALTFALVLIASGSLSLVKAQAPGQDRAADRRAIREHIDRIYQAFIHKDVDDLRATHDETWCGFLDGSPSIIRGLDGYMKAVSGIKQNPYGMTNYKIRDMEIVFHGDSAFVTFISENEITGPNGKFPEVLRLGDFFIKKDGRWIQAGSNTSVHPETIAEQAQMPQTLPESLKKQLLDARESVWRAFFSNDRPALEKLIPEETITIDPLGDRFGNQKTVMDGASQFVRSGAKLARLEFPKTEIQCYGNTAIIYST